MSTTIYDAYIAANLTIEDLIEKFKPLRQSFQKLATTILRDHCIEKVLDDFIEKSRKSPLEECIDQVSYLYRYDVERKYPTRDHECKLVLIPYLKHTLVYPMVDRRTFTSILDKCEFLKEYGYWDNSDRPDKVTNKEWKQRGKVWSIFLRQSPFLRDSGVVYNPITTFSTDFNFKGELIDCLESKDKVYVGIVRRTSRDRAFLQYMEASGVNTKEEVSFGTVNSYFIDFTSALEDGEPKALVMYDEAKVDIEHKFSELFKHLKATD